MNRKDLLAYKNAKENIQNWIATFARLHSKNLNFEKFAKEKREDTVFFKWYTNEGTSLGSFDSYKILETTYNEMFDEFEEYLNILETPEEKSFFGNKKKRKLNSKSKEVKRSAKKLCEILNLFGSIIRNSVAEFGDETPVTTNKEVTTTFETEEAPQQKNSFNDTSENEYLTQVEETVNDTPDSLNILEEENKEVFEENILEKEELPTETLSEESTSTFEEEIIEEKTSTEEATTETLTQQEEDSDYEEEEKEIETNKDKALADEIEEIRRKMEEEFQNKLKDLGL